MCLGRLGYAWAKGQGLGWARGIGVGVGVGVGVGLDEVGLGLEILNLTLTLTLILILILRLAGAGGARRWRRRSGGQAAADAVDLMESKTFAVQGVHFIALCTVYRPLQVAAGSLATHATGPRAQLDFMEGKHSLYALSLYFTDYTFYFTDTLESVEASSKG